MGKVILKNAIKRQHGHLYYVDAHGNVCEAKMSRGGRKKKKKQFDTAFLILVLFFIFFY